MSIKFDEIGQVALELKIFKLCQCIFPITLISPLGKGHFLKFNTYFIILRILHNRIGHQAMSISKLTVYYIFPATAIIKKSLRF